MTVTEEIHGLTAAELNAMEVDVERHEHSSLDLGEIESRAIIGAVREACGDRAALMASRALNGLPVGEPEDYANADLPSVNPKAVNKYIAQVNRWMIGGERQRCPFPGHGKLRYRKVRQTYGENESATTRPYCVECNKESAQRAMHRRLRKSGKFLGDRS
jgi:hypothetical protein